MYDPRARAAGWPLFCGLLLTAGCYLQHPPGGGEGADSGPPPPVDDGGDDGPDDPPPPIPGCEPRPERCNGSDDDCDRRVDEGRGRRVGCDRGEVCTAGVCECGDAVCGGECVDTRSSRAHCGGCGNVCPDDQVCVDGGCCIPDRRPVDLLFVVDNSQSMSEEQVSLAGQLPSMFRALASGELRDPDTGEVARTFPAIRDLHVGVVTSDMGTGGFSIPTCDDPRDGDDGILRTEGARSVAGCMPTYPPFLAFSPGDDIDAFARDASCVAQVGTNGCGFEQQLEAGLAAVTRHADDANDGFLRPSSVFAVIVVTDEDDCSVAAPELFNPDSERYPGDLNLRCFQYPEAVHPVRRYVEGLLSTRRGRPKDLVFSIIAGVPTELVSEDGAPDYEQILDAPRMEEQIDPDMPTRLRPSCNVPGRGIASPPRRLVRTARDLEARGAHATVGSICQADFTPAITPLLEGVGSRLSEVCLRER